MSRVGRLETRNFARGGRRAAGGGRRTGTSGRPTGSRRAGRPKKTPYPWNPNLFASLDSEEKTLKNKRVGRPVSKQKSSLGKTVEQFFISR